MQIGTESVDDMRAPTFPLLPCENVTADGPLEQDEFRVDRERALICAARMRAFRSLSHGA